MKSGSACWLAGVNGIFISSEFGFFIVSLLGNARNQVIRGLTYQILGFGIASSLECVERLKNMFQRPISVIGWLTRYTN